MEINLITFGQTKSVNINRMIAMTGEFHLVLNSKCFLVNVSNCFYLRLIKFTLSIKGFH